MTQADRYYESDEFRELLQRYETAQAEGRSIYLEPDEIADIAEYYQMLGNDVNATAAADYGLTIFPASAVLLAVRARLALIAGDISQARHYASLTDDTTSPDYHYITAEILIAEGKPDEADRYLTGILDSLYDDEREDFIIDATGIFADYQQWELAYRWLQLSTDFDAADYKELRGRIAMNRGNYEESERIFNELIDSDPYSTLYWNHLASTQLMHGNIRDSIQSSEFSIAINPDDAEAILNKANGLFSLGNYHDAREFYRRYAQLYPGEETGELYQGICCMNENLIDEGIDHLRRAEQVVKPGTAGQLDIYQELAFALSQKGLTDEALHYLDLMACSPLADECEVLVMRGHLLIESGRYDEGQRCYSRAISQSKAAPRILLRIAISIYDLGFYQQSYRMFQLLHETSDQTRTDGYAYEALCCHALGRRDEFIENVRLACEKNLAEAQLVLSELFPPDVEAKDYYNYLISNE